MALSDVATVLCSRNALLVHCSGFVTGIPNQSTSHLGPIERLIHAVKTTPDISCSTIRSYDSFESRNYYGQLGLVIDPMDFCNISVAWSGDAGSYTDPSGRRCAGLGLGLNQPSDLENAIDCRANDPWNEVCCSNFRVVGLFADRNPVEFANPCAIENICIPLDQIGAQFPDYPLFFKRSGASDIYRAEWNGSEERYFFPSKIPVSHADIYDC